MSAQISGDNEETGHWSSLKWSEYAVLCVVSWRMASTSEENAQILHDPSSWQKNIFIFISSGELRNILNATLLIKMGGTQPNLVRSLREIQSGRDYRKIVTRRIFQLFKILYSKFQIYAYINQVYITCYIWAGKVHWGYLIRYWIDWVKRTICGLICCLTNSIKLF